MGLTGGSGDYAVAYGHLGATVNLSRHCEDCRCEKCRCEDCRCEALTPPRTTSSHSTPPHPTSPHTRPIQSSLAHRHCPVPLACHFPRSWLAHTVHCTTTRVLTDPYQLPDAPPSIPAFPPPPPPPPPLPPPLPPVLPMPPLYIPPSPSLFTMGNLPTYLSAPRVGSTGTIPSSDTTQSWTSPSRLRPTSRRQSSYSPPTLSAACSTAPRISSTARRCRPARSQPRATMAGSARASSETALCTLGVSGECGVDGDHPLSVGYTIRSFILLVY